MAANKMDEILKRFPDLEEGLKEMEEKLKTEPAEREMLSLKYREMLQREKLKENLPEPEFTKAKRVESDSKVMKAKEAPEKIHIQPNAQDRWFEGSVPNGLPNGLFVEYTRTDAFMKRAKEAFCKATCNGHPPRSTCTSLGTCKEYDEFIKAIKL